MITIVCKRGSRPKNHGIITVQYIVHKVFERAKTQGCCRFWQVHLLLVCLFVNCQYCCKTMNSCIFCLLIFFDWKSFISMSNIRLLIKQTYTLSVMFTIAHLLLCFRVTVFSFGILASPASVICTFAFEVSSCHGQSPSQTVISA